jgi:NitT/TauT family transport system substrate-binding protein
MRRITLPALALFLLAALACAQPAAPAAPSAPADSARASAPAAAAAASPQAAPASPATSVPAAPVAMRIGLNSPTAYVTPAWVAKEQGFFAKYGIEAELLVMQSSSQLAPALISGEIPITLSAATGIVNSVLSGSDLVLLGGYANQLRFWLYARPEIANVRDLQGKQVAITRRGGAIHQATELALERNGLDPDRDVILIQVGSTNDSLTAMLSGAVAGGMLSPPGMFRADEQGLRMLVDTGDYQYPMILQGIATSRAWLARNEDVARRTLQALAEGLAFAHQHKERTKEIIGLYSKVDDPTLLEKTYTTLVPGFERTLYAPPEALTADLQTLAQEVPAARDARPEQFLDLRLVEELERSGFFQRLYQ